MARFSARPTIPPSAMCASFLRSVVTMCFRAAALASASGSGLSWGRMTSGPGRSRACSRLVRTPRLLAIAILGLREKPRKRGRNYVNRPPGCPHAVRSRSPTGGATRATPCASSLFFSPTRRAHRHLGGPKPGEDAVLVVELGAFHEGRKVLRVAEILGREARHDPASERE